MKNKALVLENIDSLSGEISQFCRKILEKDYRQIDLFTNLMNAKQEEIAQRIYAVEDIYLESLFTNKEQLENILNLLVSFAIKKGKKYNIYIMQNNTFLLFLNRDLYGDGYAELHDKIIDALKHINLFEIRFIQTTKEDTAAYFKTFNYQFDISKILYMEGIDEFIWEYKIRDKKIYNITDSVVTNKQPNDWFYSLSVREKKELFNILKEHKAKLEYDLEDTDGIKKIFDREEAEDLIKEKETHIKLIEKIL